MMPYQRDIARWLYLWSYNPNPTPYHIQMRNGYKALLRVLTRRKPDPHNVAPVLARMLFTAYWRAHKLGVQQQARIEELEAEVRDQDEDLDSARIHIAELEDYQQALAEESGSLRHALDELQTELELANRS